MLKKLSLCAASASVLAFGVTATPANAAIHFFSFEAPTVINNFNGGTSGNPLTNEFDFSGHFSFDELGEGLLSLDLMSSLDPDIPSFSGGPGAVSIMNYTAGGSSFDLFGDSLGGGSGTDITLLTFDFGSAVLPDLADLSEFLAGDVTATATIGADVLTAISSDIDDEFLPGVVSVVEDVEFTKKAPEPSATLAFLGLGLATVGFKLRRKASV